MKKYVLSKQYNLTEQELSKAKRQYVVHRSNTKDRLDKSGQKIEFRLTFDQWIDIWISSGYWRQRGRKTGCYVMSRINDLGHYELGNVAIQTVTKNHSETYHPYKPRSEPSVWKGIIGKDHPRSKPIITPLGRFESIAQAAAAHNVHTMTIQHRLKKQPNEYKKI